MLHHLSTVPLTSLLLFWGAPLILVVLKGSLNTSSLGLFPAFPFLQVTPTLPYSGAQVSFCRLCCWRAGSLSPLSREMWEGSAELPVNDYFHSRLPHRNAPAWVKFSETLH